MQTTIKNMAIRCDDIDNMVQRERAGDACGVRGIDAGIWQARSRKDAIEVEARCALYPQFSETTHIYTSGPIPLPFFILSGHLARCH